MLVFVCAAMHGVAGGGRARGAGRRGGARAAPQRERWPRRGPGLHAAHLSPSLRPATHTTDTIHSYIQFIFKLLVNICQLLLCAVIFYIKKLNECFINNFTRLELLLINAIIKV